MLSRFHQFMPSSPACYFCTLDTAFDACLLIQVYRYRCTYLCTPLGIHLDTRWGVSDSLGPACSDLGVCTMIDFLLTRVVQR